MSEQPTAPERRCDLVLTGGIASGLVYPGAVAAIGRAYRLAGVGGASAGALGAAAGAAAELGRDSATGGFERLDAVPAELVGGRLGALFQAQPRTRPILPVLLAAARGSRTGAIAAAVRGYPIAAVLGVAPGLGLALAGGFDGGWAGVLLVLSGLVLGAVGMAAAVLARAWRTLTVDVPANGFGVCSGLGGPGGPGVTDWLTAVLDDLAGLPDQARPLRFGQLWLRGPDAGAAHPGHREIDLRTMTTCLTEGRPYEMPWQARRFFYDPVAWARLFPASVMGALARAPTPRAQLTPSQSEAWDREEAAAAAHTPPLRRLPDAADLPVVVAARLSLSFPLLISAVPLWAADGHGRAHEDGPAEQADARGRHAGTQAGGNGHGQAEATGHREGDRRAGAVTFHPHWFSDGGLTRNFPVHLFDAALPTRPTFAIHFGDAAPEPGAGTEGGERRNLEFARGNEPVAGPRREIPARGPAAVLGFTRAAVETVRDWHENTYLDFPGYRDRIVRILRSPGEGGLNLAMDDATVLRLAERGRIAGRVMVERFTQPQPGFAHPGDTAWDNHRWVRHRALLAGLPRLLAEWSRGRAAAADLDPADPPSYPFPDEPSAGLAARLTAAVDDAADLVLRAGEAAAAGLAAAPRPPGSIRRVPDV